MRKYVCLGGLLSIALIVCILVFTATKNPISSSEDTMYYIVHSDMLKKLGGCVGIDENGNITSRQSLKIQDISKSDYINSLFIAGGNRSNNHLLIDSQGNLSEFYLLDSPNYSGVTAITIAGENIIAIMNGNVAENTYQNLLVIQDSQGNLVEEKVIDIFASDILYSDCVVYMIGSYLDLEKNMWSSKVISYSLENSVLKENILGTNQEYREFVLKDENLYCTIADMEGNVKKIEVLNSNTLESVGLMSFQKNISSIFLYNDYLYGVLDNTICKIELDHTVTELATLPLRTYTSGALVEGNHLYIFSRNIDVEYDKGFAKLGFIIDYNFQENQLRETPLNLDVERYDSIVFVPVNKD
jgi:hypothetical protein